MLSESAPVISVGALAHQPLEPNISDNRRGSAGCLCAMNFWLSKAFYNLLVEVMVSPRVTAFKQHERQIRIFNELNKNRSQVPFLRIPQYFYKEAPLILISTPNQQ